MNNLMLAQSLIAYQTTPDKPGEVDRCFQFIRKYLEQNTNIRFQSFSSNGVQSLLCGFNNISTPDILICGHLDVVPADKSQFTSRVSNGKLYGRGAIDMKGPLATVISLLKEFDVTDKNVSLLISSDEEVGGVNGVKYVLGKIKPKFVIVAEESGFDITVKQKGKALIRISTSGIAGHGSSPNDGNNAIIKLLESYQDIQSVIKNGKNSNITFNLGVISGGTANNVIPDSAYFELDFRFPTRRIYSQILRQIKQRIKTKSTINILSYSSPMTSGSGSQEYISKLKKLLQNKYQISAKLKSTNYCGDGRYCTDLKIPVIEFGPIGANYHAKEEYVDIESLNQYQKILVDYIKIL